MFKPAWRCAIMIYFIGIRIPLSSEMFFLAWAISIMQACSGHLLVIASLHYQLVRVLQFTDDVLGNSLTVWKR